MEKHAEKRAERIFNSKKDGTSITEKFSAHFDLEKMKFRALDKKGEERIRDLSFKPELMPGKEEVRGISEKLGSLGHGGNAELLLAFSLCLWKTRPDFREKFSEQAIPALLLGAFRHFEPSDAAKALSYLHKVKSYEPESEFVTPNGAEDWAFVAKEFDDVCRRFLENLAIMQTHAQFKRREIWKLFKESLKGRMSDNDSVYTSANEGFSIRNLNGANVSKE